MLRNPLADDPLPTINLPAVLFNTALPDIFTVPVVMAPDAASPICSHPAVVWLKMAFPDKFRVPVPPGTLSLVVSVNPSPISTKFVAVRVKSLWLRMPIPGTRLSAVVEPSQSSLNVNGALRTEPEMLFSILLTSVLVGIVAGVQLERSEESLPSVVALQKIFAACTCA